MLKRYNAPEQYRPPTALLLITPGLSNPFITFTNFCETADAPQPFTAFTLTTPLLVSGTTDMLLVLEVPVQPFGSVQV